MILAKDVFTDAKNGTIKEVQRIMDMYAKDFGIETKEQYAMFYAQLLAEVGRRATIKSESMNYSSASLPKVFKAFRNNPQLSSRYGRTKKHSAKQRMIANIAYANRMGNGDVDSGDGWGFRGRGFIQLTGRSNYINVSKHIEKIIGIDFMLDSFPDIVGTNTGAIISALGFWNLNGIHNVKTIDEATKKVNRYTDSYAKRRNYYNSLV